MQTSSRNGIGTKLLFHRPAGDGIFDATVWFTFLWMPLFPKSTWRVRPLGVASTGDSRQSTTTYNVDFIEQQPLTAVRVLAMYLGVLLGLAGVVGPTFFYFWLTSVNPGLNKVGGGTLVFVPVIVGFAVYGVLDYRRKQLYKRGAAARGATAG
jgi:hypothetical protein